MSQNMLTVSTISNWYYGQNIFITGATGFMGKVLLEKLLRSCPNIGRIYILIRPKRGQTPQKRLSSILDMPLFDLIRKEKPKFAENIVTITGDTTVLDLGITSEDRIELINNVSVVFHLAATIKFDEPLKDAVTKNVLAVEELLKLCYQMKKLQAFVHVSTAYCNCIHKEIEEKTYSSPVDVEKVIQCVQCLDNDILNEITPLLLNDFPNTYLFTKELAERLLMKHKGKLPIAIFRPALIANSYKEPIAGWVDNLIGATGLAFAFGKGIFRYLPGNENGNLDLVPVDLVINCLICIAWDIAENKLDNIPIYNYNSSILNPLSRATFCQLLLNYSLEYPQNQIKWYPAIQMTSSLIDYKIRNFIFLIIPAYIFDLLLVMFGQKRFMVLIQLKMKKAVESLSQFLFNDWKFHSENVPKLLKQLNEIDREKFDFDIKNVNWEIYMKSYVIGMKLYLAKDNLNTLPKARSNLRMMKILHYGIQIFIVIFSFYLFSSIFL